MLQLTRRVNTGNLATTLTLPLDKRIHSRQRVTLDDGNEAGLLLARGQILRDGDLIASEEGFTVMIKAAPESVSIISCSDALLLSRLCYHLGNRHVPIQIGTNLISYQHDHVLDDMVRNFGVEPERALIAFEPEAGAYDSHTHDHSRNDHHTHAHTNSDSHHDEHEQNDQHVRKNGHVDEYENDNESLHAQSPAVSQPRPLSRSST